MSHRSIARAIFTAVLLVSILSGCSSSEEKQEKYFERAQALYEEGDFERARLELRNVLQINPKNPQAHYLGAQIKESEGNLRGMVSSLRLTIENDPLHIDARIKLAGLLLRAGPGADDQTLELVDEVNALEPGNADSHAIRAGVLYRQGDIETAVAEAQKSLASDPSNISAITVLSMAYREDAPDQALVIINEGIQNRPEGADLRMLKISFLQRQDNPEEIIKEFRHLVSENPENTDFLKNYIGYLMQQRRSDDVEQVLQEAVSAKPESIEMKIWLIKANVMRNQLQTAEALAKQYSDEQPEEMQLQLLLAQVYAISGRPSESEQILRGIIEYDKNGPDGLNARNLIARTKAREGDTDSAQALLDDIFAIEPDNTDALIMGAELKLRDGKSEAAVMDLRKVVKNNPASSKALVMLGQAHEKNGSKGLAMDAYREALELEPGNQKAVLQTAQLLNENGDTAAIDALFEQFLTVEPRDVEVSRALFRSYINQARWSDALGIAARLEQQNANKAQGVYLKGSVLYAQKDYVAAITAFDAAIKLQPDFPEALSALIEAQLARDGQQDGIDYLQKHIEQYPEDVKAIELQGALYMQMGELEGAAESFRSALIIDPTPVKTHIMLARIYQQQEKVQAALDSYDTAIELAPASAEIHILKAGVYENQNRYQEAVETYAAALAIDANQKIAANNLAMLLIDNLASEDNYTRALEVTADFEDSDVPTFLDTRGWVYYKGGEYERALPLFKKAAESDQSQPVFHYHLGMTYLKLDRNLLAKEQLLISIENGAKFNGSEQAGEIAAKL